MPRKSTVRAKENFITDNVNEDKRGSKKDRTQAREALTSIQNLNQPLTKNVISYENSTPVFGNVIMEIHKNPEYSKRFPFRSQTNNEEIPDHFDYAEYSSSVLEYLGYLDNFGVVSEFFMATQTEIDDQMRTVLVDWLINVHRMFELVQETLFITVQLLDRYVSLKNIPSDQFQLIGITCLLIASKYEERSYPALQHYTKVADDSYSSQQIIETESKILNTLDFDLASSLPIQFLRRITMLCRFSTAPHNLAKYFIEICITDGFMSQFKPSLVAASAIYLSLSVFKLTDHLPSVELVSGYKLIEMMPVLQRIPKIIEKLEEMKLTAVYKKYSYRGVGSVSNLPQLKMHQFKNLTYFN